MKTALYLTLLVGSFTSACAVGITDDVGTSSAALECATNADCPDGLECELEHGDSFCKPHGGDDGTEGAACSADVDCGAGLECEFEHGVTFCKPHGGDDGSSSTSTGSTSAGTGGSAGGSTGGTCQSDADCPVGEECEFEHGTSFCKPHGG